MEKNNKELKRLENSYIMYEQSKKNMVERRKEMTDKYGSRTYSDESISETMELMNTMQQDIIEEYVKNGGDVNTLLKIGESMSGEKTPKKTSKTEIKKKPVNDFEYLSGVASSKKEEKKTSKTKVANKAMNYDINTKEQFDVIPLPSKGECYVTKQDKIAVKYLTAYDENIIVSPNLYRDGTFLDVILKSKLADNNINPGDLLPGDRDAIILWLRATGYGNEFPVTVTDNKTGKEFTTTIDLSKIKFKKFKLKGDENGWFDYTMPISKDEIKFSFLTYDELQKVIEYDEKDNASLRKNELDKIIKRLGKLKTDIFGKEYDEELLERYNNAIESLNEVCENIEGEDSNYISHILTNKLFLSIKAVNGNTDREYIKDYISIMNIRDSSSLRKYITENEPGLDFNIEIERPESLGGGSMTTFLSLDQFIFLNIV